MSGATGLWLPFYIGCFLRIQGHVAALNTNNRLHLANGIADIACTYCNSIRPLPVGSNGYDMKLRGKKKKKKKNLQRHLVRGLTI